MDKAEIAAVLEEMAVLLELKGENPFRIRAYRMGARALLNMDEDLRQAIKKGTLADVAGIGEHLAEKITLLATKGKLSQYNALRRATPAGLLELMDVQGLGPKRVKTLYTKLKIKSVAALKKACTEGKIAKLSGFGAKLEKNLLSALGTQAVYKKRHLWWEATQLAEPLLEALRKIKGVKKVEVAGSLRRKLETIGDLDLLVATSTPKPVMEWFTTQPLVEQVIAKGETKSSVRLKGGVQADVRIVPEKEFGFALAYFTGSKEHNIKIRKRALAKGWSLSEYGMVAEKGSKRSPLEKTTKAVTEADIYKALGLSYIPPEVREDLGEIEAAAKGKIPALVEVEDIRGTLHNHTTASDGRNTLQEMAQAAQKLRWEYIGISDHSKSSFQAGGQSEETLLKQVEEIRKLNASKKFKPWIFAGVECDILANGKLDFSDSVLKKLDFVIVSVHNALRQDEKTMTKRIIRAIENPYALILGHPTGRLLLRREPYAVNMTKVIDACIANGKIIELNGSPMRLDMDWRLWHAARDKGLKCIINCDAHSTGSLEFVRAGVNVARKGWLRPQDVINTRSLKEMKTFLLHSK